MVQTRDSSGVGEECQFETVTIDQRDFSEEQWNSLEILGLTEWTANKSWECFCATHCPERLARETLFQDRINVAGLLSFDNRFWSQKSLKEYSLVPYIDEELLASMASEVGGTWHPDSGCLPWPKKPFLASRPSAVWQPYPQEPECFFLDAYEWKNDKATVKSVSRPPYHCIDLMCTRLLMLSELSDDVSISTNTGFVLLFQRKQDGNITSKHFEVKLSAGRNDQRPFKGYLELLEEKFWTDLAPRLVPVGVPTWGDLSSEGSNEATFQRNNLSECSMGKRIVQYRKKCDWSTIERSRILLKSDKQNSSTFTIATQGKVSSSMIPDCESKDIWARPSNSRVETLTRGNQSEIKVLETELNTEIAWAKRNLEPTEFGSFVRSLKRHCVEFRNEFERSCLTSSNNAPISTDTSRIGNPHCWE